MKDKAKTESETPKYLERKKAIIRGFLLQNPLNQLMRHDPGLHKSFNVQLFFPLTFSFTLAYRD